jgi:uracil-DNA glycosylase family 4
MDELAVVTTERRHPLAECEKCPLNTPAYGFVPSTGPDRARVALVGQNPGRSEIKHGKPFVGPSGKLLDKTLAAFHLNRQEMFITNACLCTDRSSPSFTPPPPALAACRNRLLTELKQHGVESVVAMGNSAAQSLLRTKTGITQLRVGPYRETDDLPGVRIIPTFHPAACLRSSASFPSMANDFQKLVTSVPPWQEPTVRVFDTVKGSLFAIKRLRRFRKVVVDIEVAIDKEKSFDHANHFGLLCIGICVKKGVGLVFGEKACRSKEVLAELAAWLKESELIFQNGKFDVGGLHPLGFVDLLVAQDTMLKSYVLDERSGIHGLKYNAVEKLGAPRYDEELTHYIPRGGNYGHIPRRILYVYNGYDVVCTWDLDEFFDAEIDREDALRPEPIRRRADGQYWGLRELHDFLCDAASNFVYTELNGFAVDLVYNKKLQLEYKAEIAGYERTMHRAVGPINPRSPLQVKDALHQLRISIPQKKNSKGIMAETTDAEALQMMLDVLKSKRTNRRPVLQARVIKGGDNEIGPEVIEVDPQDQAITFLEALITHRKASKMDGTYVSGLRKYVYRGRVYPTIMIHSTSTGRLSQRKPSLQVIPRGDKLRRQFKVAKDDHVLIEADYGQLELRVLTWLAQEEYFRKVFADASRDLFDELEPVIKPERSFRQQLSKKDRRNVVKCFVYGLAYGREAKSIAEEFDIPVRDAQAMYRDFFGVIPNIVAFREDAKRRALRGEDLITPFGRRRRFNLITDENQKEIANEACAFFPQSIGSDICVQAFTWLRPELKGVAWCRNTVHDALYFETHQDNVEYVGKLIRQRMVESAESICGDYVPFKVDVEVGRNWGDVIKLEKWIAGERPYPCAVELWKPPTELFAA